MKVFFLLICICIFSYANTINSVAIVVNQEAITQYEIKKLMQDKNIPKQKAISELIDHKLELAEIEKYRIFANDYEIEAEMDKMLAQGGSSVSAMKAKVSQSEFKKAKENFKIQLEKRKLYEALLGGFKVDTSDEGARNYYENHQEDFVLFTKIRAEISSSNDDKALQNYIKGFKTKAVQSQKVLLSPENSDIRLLVFLSRLKENESTAILQNNDLFISYKLLSKSDPQHFDFEQIKNEVKNAYANKQRDEYLSDYFNKLRAKADIKYLR